MEKLYSKITHRRLQEDEQMIDWLVNKFWWLMGKRVRVAVSEPLYQEFEAIGKRTNESPQRVFIRMMRLGISTHRQLANGGTLILRETGKSDKEIILFK